MLACSECNLQPLHYLELAASFTKDTEASAKALLKNAQLRNRVTIVPLNKVSACLHVLRAKGSHCTI